MEPVWDGACLGWSQSGMESVPGCSRSGMESV